MLSCNADYFAECCIIQKPVNRSISSDLEFERIKKWFDRCHDNHAICRRQADSYIPSYLIQITSMDSEEPTLRLVSKPATAPYAALSYCWGINQSVRATTSTLEALRRNIDYSQLSKTIRDAIITTNKLGLRFLWVDALCIVQDDKTQTALEIANMGSVYQNAHVTISAARASSCDRGFLHDIQRPGPSAEVFRFSFLSLDMTVCSVICFCEHDMSHIQDPIEARAWTLQEYILSPRILKFGYDQRSWLCLCDELSDSNEPQRSSYVIPQYQRPIDIYRAFHKNLTGSFAPQSWTYFVALYASRELSDPNDILLAISGVANRLWQRHGGTYMAGLWREHFPSEFMWQIRSPPRSRPLQYRAPSWSWAAIDGSFDVYDESYHYDEDLKLISVDLVLESPQAPFGAVTRGSMTVRGWLRRLCMRRIGADEYHLLDEVESQGVERGPSADCYPDAREDCLKELSVWCLQVSLFNKHTGQGPSGIMLTTEDENVYRRRGLFLHGPIGKGDTQERERRRSWAKKCSLQDIIIE
jgi:hypothetical protein